MPGTKRTYGNIQDTDSEATRQKKQRLINNEFRENINDEQDVDDAEENEHEEGEEDKEDKEDEEEGEKEDQAVERDTIQAQLKHKNSKDYNNRKITEGETSGELESESESESDSSTSDSGEDDASSRREFTEEEQFQLTAKYRTLGEQLQNQRPALATEEGISLVNSSLSKADRLFDSTKITIHSNIIAKDSATLKEIGYQAKMATKNMKLGQSEKALNFDSFVSGWMQSFGDGTEVQNFEILDDTFSNIAKYNWCNVGLLYDAMSKCVGGCDFLFGPIEIERKQRVMKAKLVDDARSKTTVTANKKVASDFMNNDTKDDTSKTAEKLYRRLLEYNKRIGLFEAVLHPQSFAKSIECLFVCSFLINNAMVILGKNEIGLPYIEAANRDNVKELPRFLSNDDNKSHIIFSLDQSTWQKLLEAHDIRTAFFEP